MPTNVTLQEGNFRYNQKLRIPFSRMGRTTIQLSLSDAARLLGKTPRQVRYLISQGRLTAKKVNGRWCIDRQALPLSEGQEAANKAKAEGVRDFFHLGSRTSETRPHGLPIGNLTSQWWGNLYLNHMDHFIKRELKIVGYLRYMDDFVLFADDTTSLRPWKQEIGDWLLEKRRLQLKESTIQCQSSPFEFLGYRIARAGIDPGYKMLARYRRNLPGKVSDDLASFEQSMIAIRGAILC